VRLDPCPSPPKEGICAPSGGGELGDPWWWGVCGIGSAGISEETTTIGGAGDVLSARFEPLLRSGVNPPVPVYEEEDPDLAKFDESDGPLGSEVLEDEGDDVLLLLLDFKDPWKFELAGTLPPFGGGTGTDAPPALALLELPFSLDFDLDRFCYSAKKKE
jgi:hypothetical protein